MRRFGWVTALAILGLLLLAVSAGAQSGAGDAAKASAPAKKAAEKAPGEAKAADAQAGGEDRLSIGQIIQWGGAVGYFIIGLSVITVFLILVQLLNLREGRFCRRSKQKKYAQLIGAGQTREAAELAVKDRSLLGRVLAVGFSRMRGGYEEMEHVMSDVADDEAMRQEQGVGYFSLLAAISPLCGLLGTVVGMIVAFNEIAIKGVVTPKELADPIQKALVTTCFGLVVAIPNVVAYTFFRNKLQKIMAEVSVVVEDLMTPFRRLQPEEQAPAIAPLPAPGEDATVAEAAHAEPPQDEPDLEPEPEPLTPDAGPAVDTDEADKTET